MRHLLRLLPVVAIGIALGFLALYLWYYGIAIAVAALGYLSVVYRRHHELSRTGLLLASAGATYAGLLARVYINSLADPALGMPLISQIAMWIGLLIAGLGVALIIISRVPAGQS